jgi:Relaxase/Mobilisation nuclease domain
MNIKGRARGSPGNLANHLQKDENERVWIIGTQGIVAQDIDGALMEMDALGAGLKTGKTLYHMQINPAPTDPAMTPEQIDYAVTTALQKLELDNQPHIVIGHLKTGASGIQREHYHVVASRTDLEHNRAISDSHNFRRHEEAAREIERTLGHERVQGAHIERFGIERPERTPSAAEVRQAERGAVPAKEAKALGAEIWQSTDCGKAIDAALAEHGWQLARGDKERKDGGAYFMAIDPHGHAHELRRMVPVKAAALYERMADIDPAMLPSVKEAKEWQDERALMREAREAAKGRIDDIRPATASRDFSASTTAQTARGKDQAADRDEVYRQYVPGTTRRNARRRPHRRGRPRRHRQHPDRKTPPPQSRSVRRRKYFSGRRDRQRKRRA